MNAIFVFNEPEDVRVEGIRTPPLRYACPLLTKEGL